MRRIDTHHHMIPPDYRKALRKAGIDEAGGRAVPDWSAEASLETMAELGVTTAMLSVSTPGTTFLPAAADAARAGARPQRLRRRPGRGPPGQVRLLRDRAHAAPRGIGHRSGPCA